MDLFTYQQNSISKLLPHSYDEQELNRAIPRTEYSEKPRVSLSLNRNKRLGIGRYATVYEGDLNYKSESIRCACKVFSDEDGEDCYVMAIGEILMLRRFTDCPFILQVLAVIEEKTWTGSMELNRLTKQYFLESEMNNLSFSELLNSDDSAFEESIAAMKLVGRKQSKLVLALPLAEQGDLWNLMQNKPETFTRDYVYQCTYQLAQAVATIHAQGVVHHDIKPQNVLVNNDGSLMLSDFSNACVVDKETLMLYDGLGRGTTAFCAPEIFSRKEGYDFAVDIYSLGVLLFTLLNGQMPFSNVAHPPSMINAIKKGFWAYHTPPGYYGDMVKILDGTSLMDEEPLFLWIQMCTQVKATDRPTADQLVKMIEKNIPESAMNK
ncbi:kinase-like protein [Rozella allomycis CSF55]|uniref:Kinase-like protein n=1 Tax=Rozella allomycis (strain CSF55) TaxID=988480 RepID=A0A075AT71_ROZAC|nr:Protein kinase, catalytic domain-containing protein [Rozella allomycis CSF55]RKP19516.1 kinase-like protein [Rozella allomycis CSF55]|eukprot:EPZ33370.1 Protein kinase, catalytic domain-containing protein [Rozella allomycis CSF55]